ncbi:MAG TPA: amidohydrolase family protein [Xanthomonadaceae bacterium]|nr:amidohydrolase family protein [Xanthomonadaceae bacterium]
MRIAILLLLALASDLAAASSVAFRNVHVVPMDAERVIEAQTVVVANGRIVSLGPVDEVAIPESAMVIDAGGLFLMPGLAEMHAHVPNTTDTEAVQRVLDLFLANGVTTIRGMLGEPGHIALRQAVAAGDRDGPRIVAAGPSLNGQSVTTPERGAEMVREQHAAGFDLLKLHPGLTPPKFDAIVAAAREVGIPFGGHVSVEVGLPYSLEHGQLTVDHFDDFMRHLVPPEAEARRTIVPFWFGANLARHADAARIPLLVEMTRDAGAWVVPTEHLFVSLMDETPSEVRLERPEYAYVSAATRAQWTHQREALRGHPQYDAEYAARFLELRRELIAAVDGIDRLLLGADAPQMFNVPGFSVHGELAIYVEAGLSPYRALRTGTVNVARHLAVAERRGTVAEGMEADLVLIEGNPLENVGHAAQVRGVMVMGRWYDRAALDEKLAAVRAAVSE